MTILFDRVKTLADEQKISIVELEEKLGFGRNYLYKWKKEDANPSREALEKVADFFSVSVDYLLGRTNSRQVEAKLDSDDQEIVTLFRKHTDDMTDDEKARYRKSFEDLLKVARDLSKKNF